MRADQMKLTDSVAHNSQLLIISSFDRSPRGADVQQKCTLKKHFITHFPIECTGVHLILHPALKCNTGVLQLGTTTLK